MPNYNQKEVRVYKGNSLDLTCTGYNHTQGHRGIVWVKVCTVSKCISLNFNHITIINFRKINLYLAL